MTIAAQRQACVCKEEIGNYRHTAIYRAISPEDTPVTNAVSHVVWWPDTLIEQSCCMAPRRRQDAYLVRIGSPLTLLVTP